ncbi:MAG: MaoC/PaaZ C-terminal domain-containing protein [Solirubrobacteraceae bacterium]
MTGAPPRIGELLPTVVVDGVDPARMLVVAALLDDPVPIHYDPAAAEAMGGAGRTVNQGPLALGYLGRMLREWTGDRAALRRLRCRLHANVFAGDRLECGGEVTAFDPRSGICAVAVWVRRDGSDVLSGTAEVGFAAEGIPG